MRGQIFGAVYCNIDLALKKLLFDSPGKQSDRSHLAQFSEMIFITIGLLIGQIIEATGWTKTLAAVARPLFRFGNLGNHCSAAFTTAFFSGVAANAMLLDFYKEGQITRRQLFLSNFINQLPAFFLHLPTTFFIVIPLTGLAGVLYFLITFMAVVLRTILFLIFGRFCLPAPVAGTDGKIHAPHQKTDFSAKQIWDRIRSRLPGRISRIAVYVVPIYTLVFVLNGMGMFIWLREALAGYVVTTFMPMESLSVIILSFAAEFTSGFAAAGALLRSLSCGTTSSCCAAIAIGAMLPVSAFATFWLPRGYALFFLQKFFIKLPQGFGKEFLKFLNLFLAGWYGLSLAAIRGLTPGRALKACG